MAEYKGILYQGSNRIPGVAMRLYDEYDQKVSADTTNSWGEYEFLDIDAGNYQVRMFGEDFTNDDWFYITVTGPGGELEPVIFAGTPIMTVSESSYDYEQQGEISVAQVNFTNLEVSDGKLTSILVEYKESSGSTWETLKEYKFGTNIPGVLTDLSGAVYKSDIPLKEKPSYYDFRSTFFNGDGLAATSGGTLVSATESNVTFNGIPDVAEYIGVENLSVKNSNAAGDKIPTNNIMLEWEHPQTTGAGNFTDAAGGVVAVNADQVRNVSAFVIYMFVSNSGSGPDDGSYPVSSPTTGTWYLLDTIPPDTTYTTIRLPQKKQVMVWVGFTTPGVTTSATSEVLKF